MTPNTSEVAVCRSSASALAPHGRALLSNFRDSALAAGNDNQVRFLFKSSLNVAGFN
jgi:hypothetical protein